MQPFLNCYKVFKGCHQLKFNTIIIRPLPFETFTYRYDSMFYFTYSLRSRPIYQTSNCIHSPHYYHTLDHLCSMLCCQSRRWIHHHLHSLQNTQNIRMYHKWLNLNEILCLNIMFVILFFWIVKSNSTNFACNILVNVVFIILVHCTGLKSTILRTI